MAFIYCSSEKKIKKMYCYLFVITILYIIILLISYFMNTFSLSDIYINPISRILFIIPYIIYKCISNKYSWKINLNFTIKDWIIFILMLIILYIQMFSQDYILSERYLFGFNYYIVRYVEILLLFIFLSLSIVLNFVIIIGTKSLSAIAVHISSHSHL